MIINPLIPARNKEQAVDGDGGGRPFAGGGASGGASSQTVAGGALPASIPDRRAGALQAGAGDALWAVGAGWGRVGQAALISGAGLGVCSSYQSSDPFHSPGHGFNNGLYLVGLHSGEDGQVNVLFKPYLFRHRTLAEVMALCPDLGQ